MRNGDNGSGASEAARLYTDASTDPDFAATLRAAFRGSGDVFDLLWWRAHPGTETPGGLRDPAVELDALRRAAYSRDGSPEALTAVAERERLADENARALATVIRDHGAAPRVVAAEPDPLAPNPSASTVGRDAEPAPRPARPRVRGAVAIVAAAIVIAGLGFGIGRAVTPSSAPTATPSPTFHPYSAGQHGIATLALLETAQTPADIPPFALQEDIVASTVHVLPGAQSPAVTVYGAFTTDEHICLVLITHDLRSASTCATERTFISLGLHLRITTADTVINRFGFATRAYYEYTWSSDGAIVGSSNDFQFPAAPQL